jgi:IMP dehydrogenase
MNLFLALTFDDVLLLPQYSDVRRAEVDLTVKLTKCLVLKAPILSAPMDTVTESRLAIALARAGGLGIIHKNMSPLAQAEEVKKVKKNKLLVGAAISFGEGALERALVLVRAGADTLVIDTAHGHSKGVIEMIKQLKKDSRFKKIDIIAGNVATASGVSDLIKAGADVVKVGIGPGSICTTRVVAGIGVPQFSAILDSAGAARKFGVSIIADGGINHSGDIVKALAAGASAVMMGRLLAGTSEAPGRLVSIKGRQFKIYRGMGSFEAMQLGSKDRYGQANEQKRKLVPEGVSAKVPFVGSVEEVLNQLIGGLKSGMVYVGARDLAELRKRAKFIQITQASLQESHPHHLSAIDEAPNYNV